MTDKTYRERLVSAHYSFGSVAYILASEADAELAACRLRIAELQDENFALSAAVCPMGFGDEGGTPRCCAEARIAELEKDARRYQWLRVQDVWTTAFGGVKWSMDIRQAQATVGLPFINANYGTHLDAAIDAALNSKKESST